MEKRRMVIDDYVHFQPRTRDELRKWLTENHERLPGAWVMFSKKASGLTRVAYSDLVDELLCFGWIDSTIRPIDEYLYKQLITPRKPKSVWSRVNKEKVARLTAEGLMQPKGLEIIEICKSNGSWTMFDAVENMEIPPDLEAAFAKRPELKNFFLAQAPSKIRAGLYPLGLAKTQPTRDKRIAELLTHLETESFGRTKITEAK